MILIQAVGWEPTDVYEARIECILMKPRQKEVHNVVSRKRQVHDVLKDKEIRLHWFVFDVMRSITQLFLCVMYCTGV